MTSFTAVLKDAYNNGVTTNNTKTVTTLAITSSLGSLGGTQMARVSAGVATFAGVTDTPAGPLQLTATEVTSDHRVLRSGIVVSPGVYWLSSSASSLLVGSATTATLTAFDAYGNASPSGLMTEAFSVSGVGGGVFAVRLSGTTPGKCVIAGKLNGGALTDTSAITVVGPYTLLPVAARTA